MSCKHSKYWCQIYVCLFTVLRPAQEFFTDTEIVSNIIRSSVRSLGRRLAVLYSVTGVA
jgi:hypothetical protein